MLICASKVGIVKVIWWSYRSAVRPRILFVNVNTKLFIEWKGISFNATLQWYHACVFAADVFGKNIACQANVVALLNREQVLSDNSTVFVEDVVWNDDRASNRLNSKQSCWHYVVLEVVLTDLNITGLAENGEKWRNLHRIERWVRIEKLVIVVDTLFFLRYW